jgi:hypothetical protein
MKRFVSCVGISLVCLAVGGGAAVQTAGYTFSSPAGVLFFHVRPDHAAEFEALTARISGALDQSQDPGRRQQAASWRIYKSLEGSAEATVYLFFFDPAVSGADYDPVKVIGEAAPLEAQAVYERLKAAVIRVERMGLGKLR